MKIYKVNINWLDYQEEEILKVEAPSNAEARKLIKIKIKNEYSRFPRKYEILSIKSIKPLHYIVEKLDYHWKPIDDKNYKTLNDAKNKIKEIRSRKVPKNKKEPPLRIVKIENEYRKLAYKDMEFITDEATKKQLYLDYRWKSLLGDEKSYKDDLERAEEREKLSKSVTPEERKRMNEEFEQNKIKEKERKIQEAKDEAKEAKEEAEKQRIYKKSVAGMKPLEIARQKRMNNIINESIILNGHTTTWKNYIDSNISDIEPNAEIVPKIKYNRRKFNQMGYSEQAIYEEKLKETKNEYQIVSKSTGRYFTVKKLIYDYATIVKSN